MIEIFNRNDNYIVGGRISDFIDGRGAAEGKLVSVKLVGNVWNNEDKVNEEKEVLVDCWNSEQNEMATKVKKLNKKTYVTFLCKKKEGKEEYIAQRMKTKGIWNFPADDESPERNVLVGLVTKVTDSRTPGQYTQVTMPVSVFKKSGDGYDQETKWSDIRFWDNTAAGGRNDAKNAKIMTPTEDGKKTVVIICSENKANETRKNPLYNGLRFEVV